MNQREGTTRHDVATDSRALPPLMVIVRLSMRYGKPSGSQRLAVRVK